MSSLAVEHAKTILIRFAQSKQAATFDVSLKFKSTVNLYTNLNIGLSDSGELNAMPHFIIPIAKSAIFAGQNSITIVDSDSKLTIELRPHQPSPAPLLDFTSPQCESVPPQ
eukprot:gnl/Hemi2/17689_TR5830_c0_g1_i1.p1 gnl/Hemi2/17689_TR5830_c0_g1~~gnl/Hemi2/17689_TR5830_c0_g1_i1.p1  ORF type:complete len:123 (-),score=33.01 gnl/Hemi2/17689_TR5830_c0_g1_i1:40-372(-)